MTQVRVAGLLGASSIGAGAAGAHGFGGVGKLEEPYSGIWKTAVQYQQVHTLALLGTAVANPRARLVAGAAFASGILMFSGSNYAVAYYRDRSYGRLAPVGGSCFILGWIALAIL